MVVRSTHAEYVAADRPLWRPDFSGEAIIISNDAAESSPTPRRVKIATVSHTLDAEVAERLRHFAFRERISESAVIEFALRDLFDAGDDARLGRRLRDAGAALRRKSS